MGSCFVNLWRFSFRGCFEKNFQKGSVVECFKALDLKSGGPWFKSFSLLLFGFVLGCPEVNSWTASNWSAFHQLRFLIVYIIFTIGDFHMTSLKFKLENYLSSWDFNFMMYNSSWKLVFTNSHVNSEKRMTKHWLYCRVTWPCFEIMCNYLLYNFFRENLGRSNDAKRSKPRITLADKKNYAMPTKEDWRGCR